MFLEVNGAKLFCRQGGKGEPLVLVHGSWADHRSWNAVFPKLAQKYHLLAYDRRGHSQSERPESWGSIQVQAEDLAGVIRSLSPSGANVVASSLGAAVALRTATLHPPLVRALVLHEPPLLKILERIPEFAPMAAVFWERCAHVRDLLLQGEMAAAARAFVDEVALGPGSWERLSERGRAIFVRNAPIFLEEAKSTDTLDLDLDALSVFKGPALLSQGEHSPPFFRPVLDQIARALPQAERQTLAGAGHVPEQSHPNEYTALIATFLEPRL